MDQQGYTQPTPSEQHGYYKREIRFISNGVVFGFGIIELSSYLVASIIGMTPIILNWIYSFEYNTAMTVFSVILYIISFSLAIIGAMLFLRMPIKTALPFRKVPPSIMIGAVPICLGAITLGSLVSGLLSSFLTEQFGYTPQAPDFHRPEGLWPNVLYFISIAVLPAILEEFLCRGVALQAFRKYGDNFALIASSVLFGLMHRNLVQAPYAIIVGLVLGYFVLYSGSLWPAMLAHFINNGLEVVTEWVSVNATVQQLDFIYYGKMIGYLVLAVAAIIFLRVKKGSLFYVKREYGSKLTLTNKFAISFTAILAVIYLVYIGYNMYTNMA